jgi:hypothetical protein
MFSKTLSSLPARDLERISITHSQVITSQVSGSEILGVLKH